MSENVDSKEHINELVQEVFTDIKEQQGFPDLGFDSDVANFLNTGSNMEKIVESLQVNSNGDDIRAVVSKCITVLGGVTVVKNGSVGVIALAIVILLKSLKKTQGTGEVKLSGQLKQLFTSEKASDMTNIIERYFKKLYAHIKDQAAMRRETEKHDMDLSFQLTHLKRNMLQNGNIDSPQVKSWANGAAIHVYMMILLAQLSDKRKAKVVTLANKYAQELEEILAKYKEYKKGTLEVMADGPVQLYSSTHGVVRSCFLDKEMRRRTSLPDCSTVKDYGQEIMARYVEQLLKESDAIKEMRNFFSTAASNADKLIEQKGDFDLSSLM